jgi:hypothetical protein
MNTIKYLIALIGPNWMPKLGGVCIAIPALILGSGFTVTPFWDHSLKLIGTLGIMLVTGTVKQFNVHSTVHQVQASTNEVADAKGVPAPQIVTKSPEPTV